ncbi:MAG: transcription termination factor Rho [Pseudonocardiaceae bacterium]|nr:transcription termination factor Rho [Pseudonocardiaceae bacterium]
MVLAELRELAGELGVSDTSGMRKGDLIAAIKERQGPGTGRRGGPGRAEQLALEDNAGSKTADSATEPTSGPSQPPTSAPEQQATAPGTEPRRQESDGGDTVPGNGQPGQNGGDRSRNRRRRSGGRGDGGRPDGDQGGQGSQNQGNQNQGNQNQGNQNQGNQNQGSQNQNNGPRDDDDDGGRRRGRRFRDRNRRNRGERGDRRDGGGDLEVREDDVLLPVAGILDVLDNYAFVRTSGYLSGPNDVYVSLSLVRKHGLRRGDAITGAVRQPREGEQQRQKFNPLVRVDSINGLDTEAAKGRPEFMKLTPLYPNERLRLETESHLLTTRVIDLVMPIGKGQRALIVSPPKAGKTMVLQSIANAITTNNPECHLMVVLVDERPEEVTDMQRSVKGEVIASTFDRPPSDHTSVAELAIERARRLVEMGHDVVVLLDSITRLGRAYNLAAPASGRILSGGVDSTALYPPKRFLGAARNIEEGGSLTIFATALVETGSAMDTVIFEEFKGTGNSELKLDRKIADKRVFPAVDVDASSTRKEELLLSPDEMAVTHKLRRVLSALDDQQALELVLDRLRKSRTNIEFLMQVAKTTPGGNGDE